MIKRQTSGCDVRPDRWAQKEIQERFNMTGFLIAAGDPSRACSLPLPEAERFRADTGMLCHARIIQPTKRRGERFSAYS